MSSIFCIAKKYIGWKYHWHFENQHWVQNQGVNTLWPKKLSGALMNASKIWLQNGTQEAQRATMYTWVQCATFFDGLARVAFLFTFQPEKHKLGRGRWDLTSCQVSLNSVQRFRRKSKNMSQSIRGQRGHIVFSISPKNTNLVEDVENLLSIKFHWIPFSGFKEVENVSVNKRPGWLSCFSDRPEKRDLVGDVEILLPVKFHWIPFRGFRGKVENVSASQSPGWPSCFSDPPEKQTW